MDASYSSSSSPAFDELLAGEQPRVSTEITLVTGQNLVRGAVLGRVAGAITDTPWAGNTGGSGTIGAVTAGAGIREGTYKVINVEPAANAGAFVVEDPDGQIVGRATVGEEFSGPIVFTIADATDFVVGDGFDIVVAAGTKHKLAASAAADGSQIARGILVESVDATAADKLASMYRTGEFNEAALTYGAGHTAATVRAALEALGIFIRSVVAN